MAIGDRESGLGSAGSPLGAGESAFITGGARSGKSRFAEKLAGGFDRVGYLATAEALDDEMRQRIERHRRHRPSDWRTVEEPLDIIPRLNGLLEECQVVLVDCITLWLSNLLGQDRPDARIRDDVSKLCGLLERRRGRCIVVSNEVGQGIVPANPLARRYRDLTGAANQRLAASATRAYWLISGVPVRLR